MNTPISRSVALRALVLAELRLYFSSRRTLLMHVLAPILIAAFFGYVFSPREDAAPHVPIAIVDLDGGAVTRAIIDAMQHDDNLAVQVSDASTAARLVGEGKLRAAITFPPRFGVTATQALFVPDGRPEIGLLEDPSKATEVAIVQGLLMQHVMQAVTASAFSPNAISQSTIDGWRRSLAAPETPGTPAQKATWSAFFDSLSSLMAAQRAVDSSGAVPGGAGMKLQQPFSLKRTSANADHDREYNGYAHSFAGMGVQFILFLGIDLGVALLLARRMGLWQRLRAAPLSRATLLGSRMMSGTIIAAVLMLLIFAAAIAFFGVRIRGSVPGFLLVTLCFSVMTAAFGLFIAAVGKTVDATRGLAIVVTLILVMLGGAWVPAFIFPKWLQTLSLATPTRWAVDAFDAMTWRGFGFEAALVPSAVLLAFALAFALLAWWRFRWQE